MECSCQFASQSNVAGSYVSALIKISTRSSRTAFAYVSGFIQVDSRWIKSNLVPSLSNIFVKRANKPMDGIVKIPRNLPGGDETFCIFVTPRTQLVGGDLSLLQFDLPHDAIPSFKGLLASITYFVTVVVKRDENSYDKSNDNNEDDQEQEKTYHFPFVVLGLGSNAIPQYIRTSSLVAEPLSSFPAEHIFKPSVAGCGTSSSANAADVVRKGEAQLNRHQFQQTRTTRSNSEDSEKELDLAHSSKHYVNAYTIRDEGVVCVVK